MAPINGAQGQKIDPLSPPGRPPGPLGAQRARFLMILPPVGNLPASIFPAELNREQPYGESWVRHIFLGFGVWPEGLGDQERLVFDDFSPCRGSHGAHFPTSRKSKAALWRKLGLVHFGAFYLIRTYVVPGQYALGLGPPGP